MSFPAFREHSRAPLHIAVDVLVSGEPKTLRGMTANVSEGGMFIAIDDPRPVGTMLRLSFPLPEGGGPVAGFGEVVWIRLRRDKGRPVGMGVQYRYLDDDGLDRLRVWVARALGLGRDAQGS